LVVAPEPRLLGAPREPKYYAVKRHLLDIIGTLTPGSPVPTERLLMAQLGTSRTTVRQALAELVGEGRLVRRQGSGTYVAEPKVSWPLRMTSFTEQAHAAGRAASTRLIDAVRERATDEIAERLAVRPGAAVHRIERLRLVDDTPMALETSHLSATRFPSLARHLRRSDSLYRVGHAARGRAARHRSGRADPHAEPAQLRRGRDAGRVGALVVPRRPLPVRHATLVRLIGELTVFGLTPITYRC
jgi:DNA-binding GntR family transcriptional regulator